VAEGSKVALEDGWETREGPVAQPQLHSRSADPSRPLLALPPSSRTGKGMSAEAPSPPPSSDFCHQQRTTLVPMLVGPKTWPVDQTNL
jgi:hypothetical protein